jgi:hypothetical protein
LLVANQAIFADPNSSLHWMYLPNLKEIPIWIILSAHAAIALGTLTGGWRIVRTMGTRITKLKPFSGFCAETGGAATVLLASWGGIPVSTTHTITGSIIGVGATQRFSAVRWGVAGRILYAWILTIPMAAVAGGDSDPPCVQDVKMSLLDCPRLSPSFCRAARASGRGLTRRRPTPCSKPGRETAGRLCRRVRLDEAPGRVLANLVTRSRPV